MKTLRRSGCRTSQQSLKGIKGTLFINVWGCHGPIFTATTTLFSGQILIVYWWVGSSWQADSATGSGWTICRCFVMIHHFCLGNLDGVFGRTCFLILTGVIYSYIYTHTHTHIYIYRVSVYTPASFKKKSCSGRIMAICLNIYLSLPIEICSIFFEHWTRKKGYQLGKLKFVLWRQILPKFGLGNLNLRWFRTWIKSDRVLVQPMVVKG